MGHRSAPPHIARLFDRPGCTWSPEERHAFSEWRLLPERPARDRVVARLALLRAAPRLPTGQDVEDVVNEFSASRLHDVIEKYDPDKGDATKSTEGRFWAFYEKALRNVSRAHAARLRRRARIEVPRIDRTADGDPIDGDDSTPDTTVSTPEEAAMQVERRRMLQDCIKAALTEAEREIVRARLEEEPFAELAARLGVRVGALRVRYMRAVKKLKTCLARAAAPLQSLPRGPLTGPAIELDVLIIGGGVVGLFLLNQLRSQCYSAVLLERDRLGGGQTCHSHFYIHDGHVYRTLSLAKLLMRAAASWQEWLLQHPEVERAFMPSLFGFRTRREADRARAFWDHPELQLPYKEVDPLPAVLAGGQIKIVYESPEMCLRGHSVVQALKTSVTDVIGLVSELTFTVSQRSFLVERVDALLPNGHRVGIRARAVVLAAGCGNQMLLSSMSAGALASGHGVQQIRQSYMLAIRGKATVFPPLTGVFRLSPALFMVARACGDDVVWLVSDERSALVPACRYDDHDGLNEWRRDAVRALRDLAPKVFDRSESFKLEWFGYSAPKAERRTSTGGLPDGPGIERYGNLWVVWPTKLTLAPRAVSPIFEDLRTFLGGKNPSCSMPPEWSSTRCDAPVARERWQEAPPDMWKRIWGV